MFKVFCGIYILTYVYLYMTITWVTLNVCKIPTNRHFPDFDYTHMYCTYAQTHTGIYKCTHTYTYS